MEWLNKINEEEKQREIVREEEIRTAVMPGWAAAILSKQSEE
jgi:hypothetical protein